MTDQEKKKTFTLYKVKKEGENNEIEYTNRNRRENETKLKNEINVELSNEVIYKGNQKPERIFGKKKPG